MGFNRQSVFQRVGPLRDPYQRQTTAHTVTSTATASKAQIAILTTPGFACDDTARFWCSQDGAEANYDLGGPDGKRIISGASDKIVRQWDLQTGKEIEKAWNVPEHEYVKMKRGS
ncbi:hypothetical protein AZE42_07856 [Rhizopogon vesiculosus]|uniref:Uncharacterized protein n=1 Tax=Rhizopogon vesiculosus TaxID=180088 RepID=A0A1J8QF62_9AGAM|nr:hypothetical protein AZE42_07856 [Rhizopogon vesiculosus]